MELSVLSNEPWLQELLTDQAETTLMLAPFSALERAVASGTEYLDTYDEVIAQSFSALERAVASGTADFIQSYT